MGHQLWGTDAPRRFFSDAHWREPLTWNEEAGLARRRERVFCASMADVFERRADLNPERSRLWQLIEATPNLDWLLLTKRPQNIERLVPWRNLNICVLFTAPLWSWRFPIVLELRLVDSG